MRESRTKCDDFVAESSQSSEKESDHAVVEGNGDEKLSNIFHAGDSAPAMAESDAGASKDRTTCEGTDEPSFPVEPENPEPTMEDKITSSAAQTGDQARYVIEDH
ncbi:hypothetical protein PInf_007814 [Phytophthora infestans]|nr:hypothetical protein PInf_007814 [Phytophthora infestans]